MTTSMLCRWRYVPMDGILPTGALCVYVGAILELGGGRELQKRTQLIRIHQNRY